MSQSYDLNREENSKQNHLSVSKALKAFTLKSPKILRKKNEKKDKDDASSSKKNGGKKIQKTKNLGFSLEAGLTRLALTTSTNVIAGIIGVEDIIHKSLCKCTSNHEDPTDEMMKYVADNLIGKDLVAKGPFGARKVVYCDYTASGKSLQFIEDYIRDEVLPYYGNTHTTTSVSSLQTSNLRNEAKQIIRKCTNSTDEDAVIFVSSGTTGAIGKLIHALKLESAPVVFISPYEHHSNLLPWLEIGAEVVYGEESRDGRVNLEALEASLKQFSTKGRPMIGSFSAASNITGILSPVDEIAVLLHRYGAYAFFDFATAGPYIEMDMNPHLRDSTKDVLSYKDAIFCSIHKFVGGPGTPGLLIAKKSVFVNPVPSGVGGGTVLFVTHKKHEYVSDIEEREEGGTPAIVESIRAGLVFQLKQEVSTKSILEKEHKFLKMALEKWDKIPNLYVLGKSPAERLPVMALVISHPRYKKLLHHNFVSSLLNDIFGVQARGGCACAGPYAEDLLCIDGDKALQIAEALSGNFDDWEILSEEEIEEANGKKYSIIKPGFCRLNLPYFADDATINYIIDAVAFVAEHGWKLLPMYEVIPGPGDFKNRKPFTSEQRSQLSDMKIPVNMKNGGLMSTVEKNAINLRPPSFEESMSIAHEIVEKFVKEVKKEEPMKSESFYPPTISKYLDWYLLPHEAHAIIKGTSPPSCENHKPLFFPRQGTDQKGIRRSRAKSGIHNNTFCNCTKQKVRHVKNGDCIPGYDYKLRRRSFSQKMRPIKEKVDANLNEFDSNKDQPETASIHYEVERNGNSNQNGYIVDVSVSS